MDVEEPPCEKGPGHAKSGPIPRPVGFCGQCLAVLLAVQPLLSVLLMGRPSMARPWWMLRPCEAEAAEPNCDEEVPGHDQVVVAAVVLPAC